MAATQASAGVEAAPPNLPSVVPDREDNLTYCLAHLAAFDISPLHPKVDLLAQTRDNVQLMVNKVFGLSREDDEEGPTAVIPPEEGFRLPRQRPIPKVKPDTRWQKFMKERRMEKRKRSRLVFDETVGDWRPRYGFKSAKQSEDRAHGILEVKTGQDSFDNLFDKRKAEQRLVGAKQKMREVRNRVEAAGGRLKAAAPDLEMGMRSGAESVKRGAAGLKEALKRAQVSSASVGKFDRVAPNEPTNLQPKRRKSSMPTNIADERAGYMKAAGRVLSGEGGVDNDKAAKAGASGGQEHKVRRQEKQPKRRSKAGGRKQKGKKR